MVQHHRRSVPTREELRVWRNYLETHEVLLARLTSRLQSESSLSPGDYKVLLTLSEAPERTLRSSELAAEVGWERSRLSHHLGRMEKRGLITRTACADDVHGIDVAMTAAGRDAFRHSSVPHLRAVRELFLDAFDDEQLTQIDLVTRALQNHLNVRPTP